MRDVHAHAVLHRQLLVDLPGVLQERAVLAVRPLAGDVVERVAGRRVEQDVRVVVAGGEVVDAPEVVLAEFGLPEQVVDLVALVIDAALDRVVARVPGAGEEHAELLRIDVVVVAEALLAQVHRRALAGRREVHVHRRLLPGRSGVLHELLEADLGFGGEAVAPVVEHVGDIVVGGDRLGIGVAGQPDAVRTVAAHRRQQLPGALEGEAGAVIVGDVPVDLAEVALVVVGQPGRAAERARSQAQLLRRIDDLLQVARGNLVAGGRAVAQRVVQAVGRVGADAGGLLVLGRDEEEQLVLDDRAADVEAVGGVLLVALVVVARIVAGQPAGVADQVAGVAVGVVHRAMELVGAGLGHRVDVGANHVGRGVVVGGGDVVFGDRLGRDRRLLVGQAVCVQAERIALGHAVDGDVVVAVVHAGGGDRAGALVGHGDARVQAHHVIDRAVALRGRLQLALRDVGRQPLVVRGKGLRQGRGAHGDRAEVARLLLAGAHAQVDRRGLAQLQEHVVLLHGGHAALGRGDLERTAHAQPLRRIAAIGVGGHFLGSAGRLVHDRHRGARHGLAIGVQHTTADAGCGDVLGSERRHGQQ